MSSLNSTCTKTLAAPWNSRPTAFALWHRCRLTGRWAPDGLPAYDDATDVQRARYLYWCSDGDVLGTDQDPPHTYL
jgi:hypothetical protein